MPEYEVVLPIPHAGQEEVLGRPERFKIVACGRRWGKTFMALIGATYAVLEGKMVGWVLPSYPMSSEAWRLIRRVLDPVTRSKSEEDRRVEVLNGGVLSVKSAHNPDTLRGFGFDFLVVDEAAMIEERTWLEVLRPTLADTLGSALLISTPKGLNWFYREWWRGWKHNTDRDPEYYSWQQPTAASPTVTPEEIEHARNTLPHDIFRQEWEAMFVAGVGAVFRNVEEATRRWRPSEGPEENHIYVIGADWAVRNDYTVFMVLDATESRLVDYIRMNEPDVIYQCGRLAELTRKWRARLILSEENSMGIPILQLLNEMHLPVKAFNTTGQSKSPLIRALALAFEQGALSIPDDPALLEELRGYMVHQSVSGALHYSGPSGGHDDMVIALALAWHLGGHASVPQMPDVGRQESVWRAPTHGGLLLSAEPAPMTGKSKWRKFLG